MYNKITNIFKKGGFMEKDMEDGTYQKIVSQYL